jgi:hypothetical protein
MDFLKLRDSRIFAKNASSSCFSYQGLVAEGERTGNELQVCERFCSPETRSVVDIVDSNTGVHYNHTSKPFDSLRSSGLTIRKFDVLFNQQCS